MNTEASRPRRAIICAAVLVAVAAVSTLALRSSATPGAAGAIPHDDTSEEAGTVVTDASPARRTGSVRAEQPRSVRLPDGVTVPIRAVSTRPDGRLDVPHDIRTAGWWRGGSRLGDPLGSTLLAAHIDSTTQGLGPYAALLGVHRGQRFVLSSATLRQAFRATELRLVRQGSLAGQPWIHSASGGRRLVLVTCAPPYIRSRGGYQNLAVVTAVPVSRPAHRER